MSMKLVVVASVLKILANAPAYLEVEPRRDSNISTIEEGVEIAAQKKSVIDAMVATARVGSDVSCFEDWEDTLCRNSTSSIVGVRDENPETPLAEPRPYGSGCAVAGMIGLTQLGRPARAGSQALNSRLDLIPQG